MKATAPSRKERRRLKALLAFEEAFWAAGATHVAGVDEAGRGPLAGPVLAAAVVLPPRLAIPGVNDSKQLTAQAREKLAAEIRKKAIAIGVGGASAREIDRINILRATHLAICRAVLSLRMVPDHVIVDGLPIPTLDCPNTCLVDGDRKVHGVACASIIAKVTRDHLMRLLGARHPGYGWERNAGYGTAEHRDALARLGPTPHHRRSFSPSQLSLDLEG